MNAKEYLSQAIRLDQMIDNKLQQLESLRSLATKATTTLGVEKVSSSCVQQSMELAIANMMDLSQEINADIDRLVSLRRNIAHVISQLEDWNHRLLLEMRYVQGKSWEDIAVDLDYNNRTVFKVHGRALQQIEKILLEGSKGQ